jgi:hypothetical protein
VGALDNCIYQIHFLTKLSWRLHHIYQRFVHRGKNLSSRFLTKGMKNKEYLDFKSTHIDSFLNYFVKKTGYGSKFKSKSGSNSTVIYV